MRLLSWGCALSATSALVLTNLPATAGVFSVGGTDYEVQSVFGTWADAQALVEASPWWGDVQVALDFADVVQDAEGLSTVASCSLVIRPDSPNRGPCYGNLFITSPEGYSPFFATTEETLQTQVGDFNYFEGAVWTQNAFNALNPFEPFTGATRQTRTDEAPQYWAYAVKADDDDSAAVPEPGTILGLLGLAGAAGLGLKRRNDSE
ncbi:MAG: PEP-CTERM sorting domain-containing protein [Spirulina sp. SIO3F2]|nr:PEP-CTERM sorting domain-containing protein [Spirulina sp. SIO3F2]